MKKGDTGKRRIRLAREKRMRWLELQQCHVLVDRRGSIQLNATAAAILSMCDGRHTREDIVRQSADRAADADLQIDIGEFLDTARELGWVVEEWV